MSKSFNMRMSLVAETPTCIGISVPSVSGYPIYYQYKLKEDGKWWKVSPIESNEHSGFIRGFVSVVISTVIDKCEGSEMFAIFVNEGPDRRRELNLALTVDPFTCNVEVLR